MSSGLVSETVHALYSDHHGWLSGWLRRKLGCTHQAADLAQDVFVRIMSSPSQHTIREPRAYLTHVAHGLVVNHWRRREVEQAYLDALMHLPPSMVPSVEQRLMVLETLFEIERMLSGLPVKVRQAFLLSQMDGMKYADIATELHVSERMVKKYMAQAMLACLTLGRAV
ncbi:sigma-70 family RNA polymerase sigma factor [Methylovorus menthalis]|uniref:sigma-70 family RNA polymerase sigma factor n=1 Tax=Methylovorus menthalis TaxID=1002227 RepID=UPI001E52955C|nr:sigma-70 family RNA polymerase sigma factor [Methylovorus menthalis]MCB4811528.1 sigma-70 family RNA polymerase sigma factor [Methylovorus menthalis]